MKKFQYIVCAALLALTISITVAAKTGTISTTRTGTISTTKTGTISTTSAGSTSGNVGGVISTTRTGTISTTGNAMALNSDRVWVLELLLTVVGLW